MTLFEVTFLIYLLGKGSSTTGFYEFKDLEACEKKAEQFTKAAELTSPHT